jgi:hypothetical protein
MYVGRKQKKVFPLEMATVVIAETLDTVTVSRVQLLAAASDTTSLTETEIIGRSAMIVGLHTKHCRP